MELSSVDFVINLFIFFIQRIRILLQPSSDWGPALQIHRIEAGAPPHTDSQVPLAIPNSNCNTYIYFDYYYKLNLIFFFIWCIVDELDLELATVLEQDSENDNWIRMTDSPKKY